MKALLDSMAWISDFREGRLDPSAFRHGDQVRLAWAYLQHFGLDAVLRFFPSDLRRFAEAAGAPGKFNAPLTEAWLRLLHERMGIHADEDWEGFAASNGDLLHGDPFAGQRLKP